MIRKIVTVGILCTLCFPALALKDDTAQQIFINSATQSLDMQKNTITFTGDVVIKQGSINITADRVVVTREGETQGTEVIEAFGNQVHFSQMQDNGKLVKGKSNQLHYELKTEKLTLTGKATIQQLNSSVAAERIVYLVREQRAEAANQVRTVLEPSQLRSNNASSAPAPAAR